MTDDLDPIITESPLKPALSALRAAAVSAGLGAVITYRSSSTVSDTIHGVTRTTTAQGANIPGLLGSGIAIVLALVGFTLALRAKPMDPDAPVAEIAALSKSRPIAMSAIAVIAIFAAWTLFNSLPKTVITP